MKKGGNVKMAENKMEAVAKLFGIKDNVRFTVNYQGYKFDCRFTNGEFEVFDVPPEYAFRFKETMLYWLITGRAVIVDD
jgi:hypothetical protein